MIIGCLEVEVFISEAQSLKDKRSIIQSVLRRCRNRFDAAFSESDYQELRQRSGLAAVVIGGSQRHAEQQLEEILRLWEGETRWEVLRREFSYY